MKTLEIDIKEEDLLKYNIDSNSILLDELVEKIKNELAKEALLECQNTASEVGINKMTMKEINLEIEASRNEKRHN